MGDRYLGTPDAHCYNGDFSRDLFLFTLMCLTAVFQGFFCCCDRRYLANVMHREQSNFRVYGLEDTDYSIHVNPGSGLLMQW